jgi:CRISPR-associated protein Cpf1
MGKQTGIIFYTQAAYTSKIDPVTGWRPHLYLKYSSAEKAKKDISNFSKIEFANERFEFAYDIRNFQLNKKEYPKNTVWTICFNVERFRWNKNLNQNKGGYDHYENMTENFRKLFEDAGIDISGNILEQIKGLVIKGNEKFFRDFIFFFNLVCQIRNTQKEKDGDENDFILSPVVPFFDSRKDNGKNLPKNGDDNGAYNIARKGIVILNKISQFAEKNEDCGKMKWEYLYIYDTEWDNFSSGR